MLARAVAVRAAARRAFSASAAASDKVGFVGLGNMGKHMASNLLKAGHTVTVFDLNVAAVDELKTSGAKAAASAADAARDAQVVFTMLPSSPHVRSVYESQVFGAAPRGSLLVDCSTIDPNVTRSLGKQATDHGMRMVDAPVSGGVGGAQAGTLTFMVGGPTADFAAVKPLLQAMGKNIVHCGDLGTGQVAKICNNLVLGISMSAVSEAMSLGVKLGIDPSTLAGIINTSSGRCWSSDTYNPCPGVMPNVPSSRGYTGGFGVALMKKDLGLAADAAASVGAALPTGLSALTTFTHMTSHGYAGKDFSSVFEFLHTKKSS